MIKIGTPKLPDKFAVLRPQQDKAIQDLLSYKGKNLIQVVPTGVGKSLIYMTWALQLGRTAILTSTKALQDQLMEDFGGMGVAEIRGKDNYPCPRGDSSTVKGAMCHFGMPCALKVAGCPYYDAIRAAKSVPIVVTNYAFWLNNSLDNLGMFNRLVMDEAHDAPRQLSGFLSVGINLNDIYRITGIPPSHFGEYSDLRPVLAMKPYIEERLSKMIEESVSINFGSIKQAQGLLQAMESLERIIHYDVWYEFCEGWAYADPINLTDFTGYLGKGVKKLYLTSATATAKTAGILGIKAKVIEYESPFPVESRPVVYVPTVKVDRNMGHYEVTTWLSRINSIIESRLDRKGIIHVTSYERAKLLKYGKFENIIFTHTPRTTAQCIRAFKKAKPPAVLVSPSMTTGYDFPFDECEYQVIAKVPFPDSRRGIDQRRNDLDPELAFYLTWQTIVQAAGRGMRDANDRCQTLIIDNHFDWLYRRYKHLAPKWFLESISRSNDLPEPLEKLRVGG